MSDYRIYEVGEDGHVVRLPIERTFDDDYALLTPNSRRGRQSRFGKESEWSIAFASPPLPQM